MLKRFIILLLAVCSPLASTSPAAAMTSAPGWQVIGSFYPTNLAPGGKAVLRLRVYNVGGAPGEDATLTDILPAGVTATGGEVFGGNTLERTGSLCTGTTVVTCTLVSEDDRNAYIGAAITPGEDVMVEIPVTVAEGVSGSALDRISVVGGGALGGATASVPVTFGSTPPGLGFANMDAWATNADGTTDTQAGSHPFEMTVAFALNNFLEGGSGVDDLAGGEMRNIVVNLPPGIIGNPQAVTQCTRQAFEHEECPLSSQVGVDDTQTGIVTQFFFVVYNLVPPPGVAAQFAFLFNGVNVFLDAGVRSGGDNGITEHVDNIPERHILFNSVTIWGVPAEAGHDLQREGAGLEGQECYGPAQLGGCPADVPPVPFLTLPTSCQGPQTASGQILTTWSDENAQSPVAHLVMHDEEGNPVGTTGCEKLAHFEPSVSITPDTSFADTPAGLSVKVRLPQGRNPEGLATSGLKTTTVTLPEGVVINPGQATGLAACQPADEQLGESNESPPTCPLASKVGTDEISTPLEPDKLQGNVYVLQSNPPDLKLMMTASGDGVNLKIVGNVRLNEKTGRLTTTFENTPELPFTEFTLAFSGGAQAALATPTGCGSYESNADFTPWSTPFIEDAFAVSRFQIAAGPGGSPCASPLPFEPSMTAGATTDQAGGYTSFTMLLTRGDGQQRIEKLQFKTPEGLLGMISQVPLCAEPQAAAGECAPASQVGHTVVTAGPGPYPFEVPQVGGPPAPIYLTGPYEGAPYGLAIVVPVVAGPFNLGTVVVRARIEVDPYTSRLTITTGALPLILDGIPTDLRAIDAVIDRPNFMFNPTDCSPMSFSGTATSDEGATAPISSHFQVGSCQALKFQPNLKVSTSAKTSRVDGASLDARIVYPVGNLGFNQASSQSNVQTVRVELPKRLPSRLTTLQKACTARVFEANPASCPAASVVGHATAITPVLNVPLTGPAYFVSHGGEQFPSLVVVLQGSGVTIDLVGTTFISKAGITSSTFKQVPDVPIASFELVLPEGPLSALTAIGNLCTGGSLLMPTEFLGHNDALVKQNTKVTVSGCPKAKKASRKKRKKVKHKAKKVHLKRAKGRKRG